MFKTKLKLKNILNYYKRLIKWNSPIIFFT